MIMEAEHGAADPEFIWLHRGGLQSAEARENSAVRGNGGIIFSFLGRVNGKSREKPVVARYPANTIRHLFAFGRLLKNLETVASVENTIAAVSVS